MDALVTVSFWYKNGVMVLASVLWFSHSLKDEGNYGLGMGALFIAFIKT